MKETGRTQAMRIIKPLILTVLMTMLVLVMSACGSKTETGEMTGKLTEALGNSIVVDAGGESTEFVTADSTVYYMGSTDHICINDEINVKYHKKGNKCYADVVTLKKHVQETLSFSGTVSDVHDNRVTVTGNSLTVEFIIGSKTEIDGKLDDGDEVDVVYTGNLSEYPVAKSITVTKEKEAPKQQKVSGIVTDFTSNSIAISIDSAHSYRFSFDAKTKVTGLDKYVKVGDSVTITFTGDVDDAPVAVEINITKKAEEVKKTLNGTIEAVAKDHIVVDTGKTAYIIKTDKYTVFTGEKPAKGYKTKVTYYGQLGGKATATIVHCVKDESGKVTKYKVVFTDGMGNVLKTQKVEKGKSATAPSKPVRDGYTFKGWDKDFKKVTSDLKVNAKWSKNKEPEPKPEPKPEPEPEPEPEPTPVPEVPVVTEGTITHWTSDGDDTFGLQPEDGDEITLAVGDFTDIAPGYMAEEGDVIKATYLESDMKATKIELVSKVEKEEEEEVVPEPEPEEEEEVTPEPEPEEEAVPEPEPEEEEEVTPEPEPQVEAEPEPEPEEEEPAEVIIESGATIIEGNEEKRTAKLELDNGDTVTLALDGDTTIASGYFPAKGDEVKITYEKNGMTLREIQLVNRPAPEEDSEE